MAIAVALAVTTAAPVAAPVGREADDGVPPPLAGIPLAGATGVQLVAASNPPLIVDIDTGRVGGAWTGRPRQSRAHRARRR